MNNNSISDELLSLLDNNADLFFTQLDHDGLPSEISISLTDEQTEKLYNAVCDIDMYAITNFTVGLSYRSFEFTLYGRSFKINHRNE